MLKIEQLFKAPTEDEVVEKYLTDLEALGIAARSWRKAGALRTILVVVAKLYVILAGIIVAFIRSGFLESASGGWLTLLARLGYGVTRKEATFAREYLEFTNSGGGVYPYGPGEVRALNPVTKKAYVNVDAFDLNPGDVLLVLFEAVEQGAASSSVPDSITELETPLDLVTVRNPRAFIGTDEEKDPELRQGCLDKLASLSPRGPRGAYRHAVRVATRLDGAAVNVNRSRVSPSSSNGEVTVSVAAPSGAPAADDLTAIRTSIEAIARPDTVTAIVAAAVEVPIVRTLTVWASRADGVTEEDIKSAVETAFLLAGPSYPLGGHSKPPGSQGYVYADRIKAIAAAAHPTIYEVDGEGSDVALNPGDVAVFTITASVRLVDLEGN